MIKKDYVAVMGTMQVNFTVHLPVETANEGVACDDPAKEAALQAVSQSIETWLWGTDKRPAGIWAEVHEDDIEIETDDR